MKHIIGVGKIFFQPLAQIILPIFAESVLRASAVTSFKIRTSLTFIGESILFCVAEGNLPVGMGELCHIIRHKIAKTMLVIHKMVAGIDTAVLLADKHLTAGLCIWQTPALPPAHTFAVSEKS